MKVYSQNVYIWLILLLISACTPAATLTKEVVTIETRPASTGKYHPLNTRTMIEEIDTVLAAVESGNKQELINLFHYSSIACMTVNALGGPPPCRAGEAEGTIVEVLPILGPEGSYLWKDEISSWTGPEAVGLFAIYQVSDSVFSDENYPKGDYGIILVGDENTSHIVLHARNGRIVRLDYPAALDEILARDASKIILSPK
ncbi:MAG TPA: hypothetical protein VKE92_09120 [Anaerolineales bacterium]|nr:hypothetical protein [Anaerolineales bacterium]